jgi:rubrerythrin
LYVFDTSASSVSGVVGTNRRLIILASKLFSTKPEVFLEIAYAKVRGVAELKELYFPKTKKTFKLDGGIRISLQGKDEPIDLQVIEKKARTLLLAFLQTASSTAMAAPTDQSLAAEGQAKKVQDIMKAARERQPLPAEFQERLRLFQAGMNICPACGGTNIERRMGERPISGAMVEGAILTDGALLLPPNAWSVMGKNESSYTCKECTFTWQPLTPKS